MVGVTATEVGLTRSILLTDAEKMVVVLPSLCKNLRIMETSSLDFVYLDQDPRTLRPAACVYVKVADGEDFAGIDAGKLVSRPCLSFIELDAEIRRLHAELEEIRARAKKKFYRAYASAASA